MTGTYQPPSLSRVIDTGLEFRVDALEIQP